jgi:integrase
MDPEPLTLGKLVELFLRSVAADVRAGRNKPATLTGYEVQLRHCVERLGADKPVAELRRVDLVEHVRTWHEIQALQRVFNWALDQEPPLAITNPAKRLVKPAPGERTRIFTRREIVMFRRRAGRHLRDLLTMADETIARPQEVRPMRWDHIRTDGEVFALREFKAKKKREDRMAIRVIPITPRLRRLLDRLRRRSQPDFGLWLDSHGDPIPVSPRRARHLARLQRGACNHPEILLGTKGQPLGTGSVCRAIRRLRVALGMADGEGVVCYTFRHTGATTAVRNGLRGQMLSHLLGHASERTTRRYLHLDGGDAIDAMRLAKKSKPK